MSLPREILDQLLSGYLDDALSADEQARVERLLECDPEVAQDLAELREMREALQTVARVDSKVQLSAGFADRVLDAAVAKARSEGLGDDHPLVRLAEQPSSKSTYSQRGGSWRGASVLVALAASIVIAVIVMRPDAQDTPEGSGAGQIASVGTNTAGPDVGTSGGATPELTTPAVVASDPKGTQIAAVPVESNGSVENIDSVENDVPIENVAPLESIASAPENPAVESVTPPRMTDPGPSTIGPGVIAANEPAVDPSPSASAVDIVSSGAATSVPRKKIHEIIVLEVRRTEAGIESDSIRTAMRAAGIDSTNERRVTEQVVGVAKEVDPAAEAAGDDAEILFLQASGKSIDRFILTLVADQAGIESVGFMLAENASILGVAESMQPVDPTEVRHPGAWQLASDSDQYVDSVASELGSLSYVSIDATTAQFGAASALAGANSNGPDILSQVLVLIR